VFVPRAGQTCGKYGGELVSQAHGGHTLLARHEGEWPRAEELIRELD
jgi:predicted alpha/beta hydrolase family esterase